MKLSKRIQFTIGRLEATLSEMRETANTLTNLQDRRSREAAYDLIDEGRDHIDTLMDELKWAIEDAVDQAATGKDFEKVS